MKIKDMLQLKRNFEKRAFLGIQSSTAGFTIIELVVVISIFVIISSMILADYPAFSERVALERTAQEIALSMREAETLALAVHESAEGSGFFPGFGVHFSIATPREYILFADTNNNNVYDGVTEEYDHFFIEKSPEIAQMCTGVETGSPNCTVTFIDIVYLRPDPIITIRADGGATPTNFTLYVQTPSSGLNREIIAWFTGQIEIR